jgi:lipopolysaccharide transport system ATP-binding protein
VLWLERGVLRAEGSAKEVCRRYQATMSEESPEDSAGFRFGGRGWGDAPTAELIADSHAGAALAAEAPDFDPDAPEIGGAAIERAGLYAADGSPLKVASGGEEVELRIDCRAERPLALPVVGFLLRDRLGQSLFGDSTYLTFRAASRRFARDEAFSASFRFQLPYLPTGEYAMEMAIYEGTPENHQMLARLRDAVFLPIQSTHPSAGLLNVVIRSTTLTVDGETGTAGVVVTREPNSSASAAPSS